MFSFSSLTFLIWRRCLQWIPDDLFRFLQSQHFLLTIHLSHWDFILLTLEIKEGNFFAAISLLIIWVDDWSFEEIPWEKQKYIYFCPRDYLFASFLVVRTQPRSWNLKTRRENGKLLRFLKFTHLPVDWALWML